MAGYGDGQYGSGFYGDSTAEIGAPTVIPTTPPGGELLAGRRAFAAAQRLLTGADFRRVPGLIGIGWHGTQTDPETGSFAVVDESEEMGELIGEVVRVREPLTGREVVAYVLGARDVPTRLSLARRPFMALGLLAVESLPCELVVLA